MFLTGLVSSEKYMLKYKERMSRKIVFGKACKAYWSSFFGDPQPWPEGSYKIQSVRLSFCPSVCPQVFSVLAH